MLRDTVRKSARAGPAARRAALWSRFIVMVGACLLIAVPVYAQVCAIPGADGPAVIGAGVVNTYFPGAASAGAGTTSITLGAARGATAIAPGDLLLVIQMQDATINSTDTDAYGDGVAGEPATGATSLASAGRYEYVVAASAGPLGGAAVALRTPLVNSYTEAAATATEGRKTFQVIRVPQYSSATVNGVVTSLPWDGTSGGVVALDVAGSLAFTGAGGVDVKGQGFRGGSAQVREIGIAGPDPLGCNNFLPPYLLQYVGPEAGDPCATSGRHALKGEGVAGTPRYVYVDTTPSDGFVGAELDNGSQGYPNGDYSRGAPANAGGGGSSLSSVYHDNGGGGGGGNGGTGGRGGIGYAGDTARWSTNLGGFGGADVGSSLFGAAGPSRLVMGGGGGAGDSNGDGGIPPTDSSGAAGGGIVMIRAGSISGAATINADGASAPGQPLGDGAGGGGAGGSVLVISQAGAVGALTVNARGGAGGDANLAFAGAHGPGGGGGGGVVLLSGAATVAVGAGANGTTAVDQGNLPAHGATPGTNGISNVVTAAGDAPTASAGARCLPAITASKTTSTPARSRGVDTTATYTITLANPAGGGTAYGVALTDDLPTPFTYGGAAVTPTYTPAACGTGPVTLSGAGADPVAFGAAGGNTANSFTLPPSCAVSVTFDVALNAAANGTYQNPATFSFADPTRTTGGTAAGGGNPVATPGAALASGATAPGAAYASGSSTAEDVTIATLSADLSLTMTVAPAAVLIGQNATFTVTLANAGPDPATGIVVRDLLPAGYTLVSATAGTGAYVAGTGLWSVATLASGASTTLVIVAAVNPTGPYTNSAEVTVSAVADPDSTPNNGVATEDDFATATPAVSGTGFTALVFNDANANGTQDAGEGGLANVQVVVTDSIGTVRALTTNAGGMATALLPPGATTVDIVDATLPPGAVRTAGTDPTNVTIVAGTPASTRTGFQVRGTLAGRVFRDNNGNGIQDAGEPGIGNAAVTLTTSTAQTLNVVTDAGGNFSQIVPAGATAVRVADPTGFTSTTNNNPQNVVAAGGVTTNAAPVGFAPFATLSGSVWRDLNSNRQRDGTEAGLPGWRVDLLNSTTGVSAYNALTDASGRYTIASVVPATTYRVRFTSPGGVVWGVGVNGESGNPQANSVVNAAQRSLDVTPQPGATLVQQSLPYDPQGIAYDTLTRLPLAGAQVVLTGPAGFAPAAQLLGGAANATQTTPADGAYRFVLLPGAPAGVYVLTITAPTGYTSPSLFLPPAGTLDPTGQGVGGVFRVQGQTNPPTGAQPTTYYLRLDLAPGDPDIINNHVPLDPASLTGGAVRLTKRADRATASVGGLVAYTITIENTTNLRLPALEVRDTPPAGFSYVDGSARLDGTATGLAVRGPRPLVFSGIDLNAGQRRTLRYVLRVGAGVVRGEYPNTAGTFLLGAGVGNADTARVSVIADPTFDDTSILGKVFEDTNGDGWQDPGEKGISGVRLATVEGLVAETDRFGRFHFAAVDGGFMERGRNFIVKLDPSTLPAGSTITTGNPRVERITPGMPSRFDFGVKIVKVDPPAKRIDLKLAEIYFVRDSAEVAAEYLPLLTQLADRVRNGEKATITIKVTPPSPEGCTPACRLGRLRIDAVKRVFIRLLGPDGLKSVDVIADYTAAGGYIGQALPGPGWLERFAYSLLAAFVPEARAARCPDNICETQPVEIRTKYPRTLANAGHFWATEDSTAVDPRLASEGPDRLPVAGGRIDADAQVAIYTNYSVFVQRYEVVVWGSDDIDRVHPLATLPVKFLPGTLRSLLLAHWDAKGVAVPRDDQQLVYIVRAYGAGGGVDETAPRRIQLVSRREYDDQSSLVGRHALGDPTGASGAATQVDSTPLKGRYLVMKPVGAADAARLHLLPLALVDPLTRTAADASGGLAPAEASVAAGAPAESVGAGAGLPAKFDRKSLLVDLAGFDESVLDVLYGRNDLARRGVAVHGSRVRVTGEELSDSAAVRLNGQLIPVGRDGNVAYETILPIGKHELFLDVLPTPGDVWPMPLSVDVTGRHLFMVGLADLTWQKNSLSGSVEPLSADDRYLKDTITEGRLALYLKGKIRGKYLLTTQLDTHEEQLGSIVGNFDNKDPRTLLRNIDPDQYYPVYGDDSTTIADTSSQGRLYVRLDWDKSHAVLGNFNTNFTGTEFAQYNRTLYGANLDWHGLAATTAGDTKTNLTAFASQAQSALGHDEFLGTGGSLYYLRQTDILQGSAKAQVQIIDPLTERTLETVTLVQGIDYEIDELQGRMILAKPLSQIALQQAPYLVRTNAQGGNRVVMVVDYEYQPLGFAASSASFGVRGKQWVGDHVALGATVVDESRDAQDYRLGGADVTLQAGRGTYLKVEYAKTEATQTARYFSNDGGLSFSALNPITTQAAADNRTGEAYGAEARMNLRERGLTARDATVAAWYDRNDNEFAVVRRDDGFAQQRAGLEAIGSVTDTVRLALRASRVERDGLLAGSTTSVDEAGLQASWDITKRDQASAQAQYIAQQNPGTAEIDETLAALQYRRILSDAWQAYAIAQHALSESASNVGNNLYTLGTRYAFNERWALNAEAATGDRGDAVTGSVEYRMNERHALYGTFSHSLDRTDDVLSSVASLSGQSGFATRSNFYDNPGNNLTLGSRWQVSDQTRVFNEAQFNDSPTGSGLGHVFGLDFQPRKGWRLGGTIQKGDFAAQGGTVQRDALSANVGYSNARLNWSSRLEYRTDSGLTEATQYLSSNRLEFKLRDSFRLLGKINYSKTSQDVSLLNDGRLLFGQAASDAQFAEASLGLAYRPTDNDRFNWLAKVTYLYDLTSYGQASSDPTGAGVTSFAQSGHTDQKSTVYSWEGVYRLTHRFDLGGKVARRSGEVRLDRASGDWVGSAANFAAVRVSWEIISKWDAMGEYRWLDVPDAQSRRMGFLVGVNRELSRYFKLGVGYNFTDFSDDLTQLDYRFRGIFVNAVGKY
jgi:uncharacterized repeat protein (TIGR01451 family)